MITAGESFSLSPPPPPRPHHRLTVTASSLNVFSHHHLFFHSHFTVFGNFTISSSSSCLDVTVFRYDFIILHYHVVFMPQDLIITVPNITHFIIIAHCPVTFPFHSLSPSQYLPKLLLHCHRHHLTLPLPSPHY